MEKNIRLQFEVTPSRLQELEVLMRTCDLSTKKELFNNALTLLEWAVKERAQGHTIASISETEKKLRELEMPVLSAAAKKEVMFSQKEP